MLTMMGARAPPKLLEQFLGFLGFRWGGGVKFIRFYHQSSLRVLDGFCRGRGLRIWGVDLGMYVSTIGSRPPRCHNLRWFSGVKGLWL